jgi:DNA-binding beta-propeller fold protein YncE
MRTGFLRRRAATGAARSIVLFLLAAWAVLAPAEWDQWVLERSDARLVGQQPLDDVLCLMPEWGATTLHAAGQAGTGAPATSDAKPIRTINDPYPTFAGIAVDPVNHEVVVSDENRFSLLVYDRTLDMAGVAEPKRRITGHETRLEFICGVAIDPRSREIYTVNNDTMDNMIVFGADARGDAKPSRELKVDHGAWGISLDLQNEEVAITTQHINKISVYSRTAQGKDVPLRIVQGPATGLADPHGLVIDSKNNEIVVANHGSWHLEGTGSDARWFTGTDQIGRLIPSTGRIDMPSITVYARTAQGDAAPLRKIQGPKTRLNLPSGVSVDAINHEIAVANDGGNSVLIFSRTAAGDVAPIREISGPATGLKNPSGVSFDLQHNELWVSNWGGHSANVYPRDAAGNVKPLRIIRSAPRDAPMPGMGNPGAVAYDAGRDQLLVPN